MRDGTREEGKYKCNVLITSNKKKHMFLMRSAKFRERIEASVSSAQRASKYALQKADIAVSRAATARSKADMADNVADNAKVDSEVAVATAREFAPDFKPSVLDRFDRVRDRERFRPVQPDTVAGTTAAGANAQTPTKSSLLHQSHQPQHPPQHPSMLQSASNNRPAYGNSAPPPRPDMSGTPLKHTQFAVQPASGVPSTTTAAAATQQRRTSMMHKQDSFDYMPQANNQPKPAMGVGGAMPSAYMNNAMPNPSYVPVQSMMQQQQPPQQQQQQQQYQQQQQQQQFYQQTAQQPTGPYGGGGGLNNYNQQPSQMQSPTFSSEEFNAAQQRANNIYYNSLSGTAPTANGPYGNGATTANYAHNSAMDPNAMGPSFSDMTLQSDQMQQQQQLQTNNNNASIDHFDHYKRVPSRDSSMDRYARAASRMGAAGSRQPSMDRHVGALNNATATATTTTTSNGGGPQKEPTPEKRMRSDSAARLSIGGGVVGATAGAALGAMGMARSATPSAKRPSISSMRAAGMSPSHGAVYSSPNQPFEDVLLRQRTLGQDIIPSPREPKRTESLYLPPKPLIGNGSAKSGAVGGGKPLKVFAATI